MSILYPQPAPLASDGDVWAEIIAELDETDPLRALAVERRAQGIERYGTPLQRQNGRDHLVDALQETLDLWVYLRAAGQVELSRSAQGFAFEILRLIRGRDAAKEPNMAVGYGFCPVCGASGVARARHLNGNDTCERGHTYPSADARSGPFVRAGDLVGGTCRLGDREIPISSSTDGKWSG